jgi:hypothetical protein
MLWEDNFKKQLPGTIKSTHKRIKEGFVNGESSRSRIFKAYDFVQRITVNYSSLEN